MALILVFWSLLPVWLPGGQAQEPGASREGEIRFSHSTHLNRVGMQCVDCHTRVEESRESADDNLPEKPTCLLCHAAETDEDCLLCHPSRESATNLKAPTRGFRFSHQKHLALPDLAETVASGMEAESYPHPSEAEGVIEFDLPCSACHRGMEKVDLSTGENLPRMADCLICHQASGNAQSACRDCHLPEFDLFPASHEDPTFFDSHSGVGVSHNLAECRQCHSDGYNPCTQCH